MRMIFTLSSILIILNAHAQTNKAGMIDSSFGTNGITITGYPNKSLECYASALQNDDKIISVGTAFVINPFAGENFLIVRYTKDGTLDKSFSSNGIAAINIGNEYELQVAMSVEVQQNKKIVVSGYISKGAFQYNLDIATIRLNKNGSLDSSFGKNGIVTNDYGLGDVGNDIAIQHDGKIVVEGVSGGHFISVRYLPDGKLDSSFGNQGKVITVFDKSCAATALVLQPDGKIIAAGNDEDKVLLARYLPDGRLDKNFGNKGKVRTDFTSTSDKINDMVLQPDGKIIVAGKTDKFYIDSLLIARYSSDGSLDNSFGKNGFLLKKIRYSSAGTRVALQIDGKIIIAGSFAGKTNDLSGFFLSRFKSNGDNDSSFGNNGYSLTSGLGTPWGLNIQSDNKIVLAGYIYNTTESLSLSRYNNDLIKKLPMLAITPNENAIIISPNPAKNILHIEGLSSNKTKITVVDFAGNIELQAVANNSSYNLNIASLKPGNYLLKIETSDEVVTKQFVKE